MIYYYSIYEINKTEYIVFSKDTYKIFNWVDKSRMGLIKFNVLNIEQTRLRYMPLEEFNAIYNFNIKV